MLVNHLMRCHFILGILLCIKTGVAHYKAVPCLSILGPPPPLAEGQRGVRLL